MNGETENAQISLTIDPDRANLAGITNMDVANSSTAGMSGTTVSVLQEGQKQIPIVARLRMDERAQLSDIQNLYVYGSQDSNKIPLVQISNIDHDLVNGRIVRLEQFRTMNSAASRSRALELGNIETGHAQVAGIAELRFRRDTRCKLAANTTRPRMVSRTWRR